mgnify:CR=1 FL=1
MWIDEKYKRILNILKKDWRNSMKVVLLAGGFGTRISEESQFKPKPMIEIGGKPILWHIMKALYEYGTAQLNIMDLMNLLYVLVISSM